MRAGKLLVGGLGLTVLSYGAYAGAAWYRYGRATRKGAHADTLLDRFMPEFEVVERQQVCVAAPSEVTMAALSEMDLQKSAIIRTIFKSRELIMGAEPDGKVRPRGLLAQTKSLGWEVLAEIPGREIAMGAVTQPWVANVVFRAVPAPDFKDFDEPGFVKIVWTLRADPIGESESMAVTETRVATTDATAQKLFRRYWSLASPGIVLIRWIGLRLTKRDAERRTSVLCKPIQADVPAASPCRPKAGFAVQKIPEMTGPDDA